MLLSLFFAFSAATPTTGPVQADKIFRTVFARMQAGVPNRLFVVAEWPPSQGFPMGAVVTVPVDRVAGANFWRSAVPVEHPNRFVMGYFQVGLSDGLWVFSVPGIHGNPYAKRIVGTSSPFLMAGDASVAAGGLGRVTVRE